MQIIEFFIGALLANAMPHLIFGLTKTHFLGLFGYSAKGNIAYAILQFIIALVLIFVNYSYKELLNNGYLIGGITVLFLYLVFGKFLVKFYGNKAK
ncbi:hypothetical protein [Lacinutrix undariae]